MFNETYGLGQFDFFAGSDPSSDYPSNPPIYTDPSGYSTCDPSMGTDPFTGAVCVGSGGTPAPTPGGGPYGGGGGSVPAPAGGGSILSSIIASIARALPGTISAAQGYPAPGTPGYYPAGGYPGTYRPATSALGGSFGLTPTGVGGQIGGGTILVVVLIAAAFMMGKGR